MNNPSEESRFEFEPIAEDIQTPALTDEPQVADNSQQTPTPNRRPGWAEYAAAELTTLLDGRRVKLDADGNRVPYPHHLT